MKIAFIGLGQMGSGIAKNLLRAGHEVSLYNRSRGKAEALISEGGRVVDSPAEACRNAELAMTMLANDQAVEEIVFGKDGVASALGEGKLHVSSSTISTSLSRKLAHEHTAKGQNYVSAPVFGRPEAAEAKKLIVVAAGQADILERLKPVFEAIGRAVYVVGQEPWQANALKLSGNFMIASMMETFAETFALMRKSGVDHRLFLDIMNDLFGSPVYKNYGGFIANEKFEPAAFTLKLGFKDLRLLLDAAFEQSVPMPFASLLREQFISCVAHGQEDLDWSSIALAAKRNAGL